MPPVLSLLPPHASPRSGSVLRVVCVNFTGLSRIIERQSYRRAIAGYDDIMSYGGRFESPLGRRVAQIMQPALETLLGKTGLRVLEYHLEKLLQEDPYSVLCSEPHRFYLAVKNIFGQGADMMIRIMAKKMIEEGALEASDPSEFLEALKDQRKGREKLLKMLRLL